MCGEMDGWTDRDKLTPTKSKISVGNSLAVQWLALGSFTAMGPGLIPGWGTKIPQVTWPKKKKKKINVMISGISILCCVKYVNFLKIKVDRFAMELEHSRDLNNTIVHIDMDAFYAAVEMRDNPELKDKPIAVGSVSMLVSR